MALLTKSERKSLDQDGRRTLRAQRRLARRTERDEERWGPLLARAEDLMAELGEDDAPGFDKMDEVLDVLAEEIDELIQWDWMRKLGPIGMALAVAFEAADGLIVAALLRPLVKRPLQRLYDRLKLAGVL